MPQKNLLYLRLLQQCKAPDLELRLAALKQLQRGEYPDLLKGDFLLERLRASTIEQEQLAILELMSLIGSRAPAEALIDILADQETSSLRLREAVVKTLAAVKA